MIQYTNIMPDTVHCFRYILYTWRFGICLYSHLLTDLLLPFQLILEATVGIEFGIFWIVGKSKVKPKIVDVRVKSKGLVTHSLILNLLTDDISSAYDTQRLIEGLLNKYVMSASQTGNEKIWIGKTRVHFKNETTEFLEMLLFKYQGVLWRRFCGDHYREWKRNSKTRQVGAKLEYPTFQDVTGTEQSWYRLQFLQRINCALNTRLRHRNWVVSSSSLSGGPEFDFWPEGRVFYLLFSVGSSVPSG